MQPWHHAQSSARKFGRHWTDYLPVHEFMDSAKTACPDLRHRIVLHNSDLGPALAELAFPEMKETAARLARHHVREDLGGLPELDDWLATANRVLPGVPRSPDLDTLIRAAADKTKLDDTAPVREVYDLLMLPTRFSQGNAAVASTLLMNGFGPTLVRRLLGPPRSIARGDGKSVVFDPSWVAEGIIVAHFGRIPALSETLSSFSGQIRP